MGRWTASDEADFRACTAALRDRGIGPWPSNIFSAVSDDGLTFAREEKLVLPSGSAFEAVALPNGGTAILSVCFDPDALITRRGASGRLDLAYSEDGLSFTRDLSFRIVGLYTQEAIDPDIVVLPDDSLRIYYLAGVGAGDIKGRIFSARSTDGHVFWQEPGIRYDNPFRGIDHKTIHIDGERWKLFNHVNQPILGRYEAKRILDHNTIVGSTSLDGGMTFTVDDELPGLSGSVLSVKRYPQGLRMYYHDNTPEGVVIKSAFSSDEERWQEEEGIRLEFGGCPTVVQTRDGRYRMYYEVRGTDPLWRRSYVIGGSPAAT